MNYNEIRSKPTPFDIIKDNNNSLMEEMAYYITDGWGDDIDDPTSEEMQQFLDKLDIDDPEHCEVWLTHNSTGWTISYFPSSKAIIYQQNDNEYKPRHLTKVSRDKMLKLWQTLAKGEIEKLENESWQPGHNSE